MRRVFNAGIPGDTTRELLARFQRDVAMRAPDLVILWAGVNDRLYPGHTVEPAEFRANYAELLDRIRVIGAKVLIGTLPPQYKPYLFTQFPPIAEFPETPDAALKAIAEGRMASQRAAAAQAAEQQRAQLDAMQQRIDQTVAQARQKANEKAWDEYEVLAGVHKPEDIPPRVMELVNSEGMTPIAAHWRYQAEQNAQAVQIEKKNNQNKMTSPGSVQGNEGDTSDPFLRGLLGL